MGLFRTKQTIEPDAVPTTVEEAIPVQDFYEDGIALVGRGLWSKTFRFSDINYATASRERKEELFLGYSAILNSFDAGAMTKITVCNRRQSQSRFEKQNLLPLRGDRLDRYRDEYNRMLTENAEQSSGITQEKYLTVTVQKPNYNEAKSYFNRVESEFAALFLSLGSRLEPLDAAEKLRVLFDFYHYGAEDDFLYEPERYGRRGYTFKDAIAPDSMEFRSDCFRIDGRYGRVLYLRDYANFIKDSFLAELTDIDRGLMFSIDCNPIPTDEAIRQGEGKLLAVETNISNWQRKQNRNQNFSADVPYDMEKQRAESREFLDDLVSRDQRMIPSLMTLCHTAESKEQLDADTESIRQCARKHLCSMNVLRWQQLEGLNTVLPYGVPKLSIRRTLTTEALAVFMPFRVQEICHRNGIYFANNAISKNLMTVNRAEQQNGNAFICGVSGSGKSLLAKQEAISLYLSDPDADILIIDPEREYGKICDALGGETITVSAASPHHINALDMSRSYGDESNPVTLKSEFLCSLCEEAAGKLTAGQKSVIDRCTASVYREYYFSEYLPKRRNPALQQYKGNSWAGPRNRWCTGLLKTKVVSAYLKELKRNYEVVEYIGIAADEPKRVRQASYPLVEWGMTEQDCLAYCYARGFDWGGLYRIFHRVSCWCCPLQSLSELRKLYAHFPELWNRLKAWDESTWRQFRADYSVKELEIRFALEEEWETEGKGIRNRAFYDALRARLSDCKKVEE